MSDRSANGECQRLRRDVELALSGPDPLRVLPLLHRLAARAESGSDESVFAHRQLAEVLLERDPWRAALHARRVTRMRPDDDRGWAALGLSQSLLGNHLFASHALVRALACSPDNPWYAHNLGHTLDIALDRPREAVEYLRRAYDRSGRNAEVATSLAHALARTGQARAAKDVLSLALAQRPSPERRALLKWIDAGARGRATSVGMVQLFASTETRADEPPCSSRSPRAFQRHVQGALRRGLARLPLDASQRGAAVRLERAAFAIAAAAAWVVISGASIPLSQAEVAACFRTSVGCLRQHLGSVRARSRLAATPRTKAPSGSSRREE
jgi:tetratricopeptide (TPR) repeat protein